MTEFIGEGVRAELVLRELGEAVLWLKSVVEGINNMDTAMRANHSGTVGELARLNNTLRRIEYQLEAATARKTTRKKKRK